MPAGQVCGHCRTAGHNRTTCKQLIEEREQHIARLEALVAQQSSEVSTWKRLVQRLRSIISQQREDLELAGLSIEGYRAELAEKEAQVRSLEERLGAFAIHSNPRRY